MEAFIYKHNGHTTRILPLRGEIEQTLDALHGLSLLQGVLQDSTARLLLDLLQELIAPQVDAVKLAHLYSQVFYELAELAGSETLPHLPDAWQAYLVGRLIDDRNPWSTQVERAGATRVAEMLRVQARRDLHTLQRLFEMNAQMLLTQVKAVVAGSMPTLSEAWSPWLYLEPVEKPVLSPDREMLASSLAECPDWSTLVAELETHWADHGTGPQACYRALRWSADEKRLVGIAHPDTIQLVSLVAQERQQTRLKANIERFLSGLPAQDMLLYGPPGTGKSSSVKALANAYAEQGLRLVEVSKEDIGDLLTIVTRLRDRAPHYLLFIDDLSFEEHEIAYKALKVVLEGTAEARPANVLICATSNRLNLIRENFSDRGQPGDDVNWRDTLDEKQSLAHRFALRITFMSPDQQQYLSIVTTLAHQRKLELPIDVLQERALQWERQHTGRSGRIARQFIDDMEAELKHGV